MVLRKSNSCKVKIAVSFEKTFKFIGFLAYLFSIGSHLIKHTPSYKVHSSFAVNHLVRELSNNPRTLSFIFFSDINYS